MDATDSSPRRTSSIIRRFSSIERSRLPPRVSVCFASSSVDVSISSPKWTRTPCPSLRTHHRRMRCQESDGDGRTLTLHLQLPAAYVLQTTTNRRLGLWSNLYGHESARSGLAGASLEQSSTLEYRLRVVQRAQREPMCARIVLQTLTGPYGRFNVRQPELLPLCHQLLRHAC